MAGGQTGQDEAPVDDHRGGGAATDVGGVGVDKDCAVDDDACLAGAGDVVPSGVTDGVPVGIGFAGNAVDESARSDGSDEGAATFAELLVAGTTVALTDETFTARLGADVAPLVGTRDTVEPMVAASGEKGVASVAVEKAEGEEEEEEDEVEDEDEDDGDDDEEKEEDDEDDGPAGVALW